MTLNREGWIDDRPYAVIRDRDGAGEEVAYVCLKCGTETIAEPVAFAAHRCHKAKGPNHLKRGR
jgi:hypothetical protein